MIALLVNICLVCLGTTGTRASPVDRASQPGNGAMPTQRQHRDIRVNCATSNSVMRVDCVSIWQQNIVGEKLNQRPFNQQV